MVGPSASAVGSGLDRDRVVLVAALAVAVVARLVLAVALTPVALARALRVPETVFSLVSIFAALAFGSAFTAFFFGSAFVAPAFDSDFVVFVARVRLVAGLAFSGASATMVAVFLVRLRGVFGACSELEPEVTAVSPRVWAQSTPLRSRGV
jgi:hypothetical protein